MQQMTKLDKAVQEILDKMWYLKKKDNGNFTYDLDVPYGDKLDTESIKEIFSADCPIDKFSDIIFESYMEYDSECWDQLRREVRNALMQENGPYPNGLSDEDEEGLEECLNDMVEMVYPFDHYLKQKVQINIFVDTGDGNYDFTLNNLPPAYCGDYNEHGIDPKASLAWLAKSQGYTRTDLWRKLQEEGNEGGKGFLISVKNEVWNISSHMNVLVFLVEMTLEDCLTLNDLVKLQDRHGHYYDTSKNPYCGYIILDKKTMCGLYDPWNGGGSILEIDLEKDVKLPIKYIRSALPDGCDGYSIENVYGMDLSAWKYGGVKDIHAPNERTLKKELKEKEKGE